MDFEITFLEGVITFVSPCLLPMLPIYIAYFAGGASERLGIDATRNPRGAGSPNTRNPRGAGSPHTRNPQGAGSPNTRSPRGAGSFHTHNPQATSSTSTRERSSTSHTLVCAAGFILGFTLIFTAMGALAGTIGRLLLEYQTALNVICGTIVIVLGLNYLGVLRIPLLQRTLKPSADVVPRGFWSSLVFGMVFAIGWTPCVGAFLASALSLAASSAHATTGVALLLCYSLGLGLPFAIAAVLIDQLEGAFKWIRTHYDIVNKVSGAVLVIVGALMATGMLGIWLRLLSV